MTAREIALQTAKSMRGQCDQVVTLYNTFLPRPRGYKAKLDDLKCAEFVSDIFITHGEAWTAIVPPECAAWRLYRNMEALDCTHWGDDYNPVPGDLIFFGVGSSVSHIDHVAIVDEVKDDTIYFWDIRDVVDRRSYTPGSKSSIKKYGYILAYAFPDYAAVGDDETPAPAPDVPQTDHVFAVGDLVTVNPGAKWYKGQSIKMSVINDKWYVMSVKGDRVVLGMNLAETRNIQSPIHACDISLVVANGVVEQPPENKVTITVTIDKETLELLDIMATGNHRTMGEIIDLLLEDAR